MLLGGDMVVKVNDAPVASVQALTALLAQVQGQPITLVVHSNAIAYMRTGGRFLKIFLVFLTL
eukprot:m.478626 g.478626  ORF g.478626 m.478626 type:complete len:63 (-) comp57170_c1_seq2:213-401(-)